MAQRRQGAATAAWAAFDRAPQALGATAQRQDPPGLVLRIPGHHDKVNRGLLALGSRQAPARRRAAAAAECAPPRRRWKP